MELACILERHTSNSQKRYPKFASRDRSTRCFLTRASGCAWLPRRTTPISRTANVRARPRRTVLGFGVGGCQRLVATTSRPASRQLWLYEKWESFGVATHKRGGAGPDAFLSESISSSDARCELRDIFFARSSVALEDAGQFHPRNTADYGRVKCLPREAETDESYSNHSLIP